MSGNFEALLAELNDEVATMAKALPAEDDGSEDDEKIQAAAAEGEEGHDEPDGDEDGEGEGDGDGDEPIDPKAKGKMKPMAKSLTVTTADGEQVEAIDGTELVKSLMGQMEQLGGKLNASEEKLAKALTDTLAVVKGQGDLIKALSEQVSKLRTEGRGRKSSVTMHERPDPMAKSMGAEPVLSGNEIMAKSLAAQRAGQLTSYDVSRVENYINAGMPVPAEILSRLK